MVRSTAYDEELIRAGIAVRLWQVCAGYAGPNVLESVDFEARAGAVTFVTGPAGAGKTTLVRMLRLGLRVRAGRFALFGADATKLTAGRRAQLKRRIGVVDETPVFVEHLSVFENASLPLVIAGKRPRDYTQDVRELLDFVGCSASIDDPVGALSAGERRRVALARALAAKPDLILADEPGSGFSPEAGARLIRVLVEMRRVGATVIIASQDAHLLDGVEADRWRIEMGRVRRAAERIAERAG